MEVTGKGSAEWTGGVGTLDSFLIIPVTGTVNHVSGVGSTNWTSTGALDLTGVLGVFFAATITMDGTGMTPGQILPDFTSLFSGEIVVDPSPTFAGFVKANIDSVTIVPEPTTAVLLGLGLAGLGVVRRRSC